MNTYNRVMEYFWLSMSILVAITVTFMGFKEGFGNWAVYYLFSLMSAGTFWMRRFMRKRMERHLQWLEEQKQKEGK